jgi:WD40 repeat protein
MDEHGRLVASLGHSKFAYSRDGTVLASWGRDRKILITDASTNKERRTLDHPDYVKYAAYPADGKTLVSFAAMKFQNGPGECRVWDLATGEVLHRWEDVRDPTLLSPDGKTLVTGAKGGQLRIWDTATRKELHHFDLPRDKVRIDYEAARCAAFSPDGKLLAAGDMTNRVHVWDLSTGKELHCSPPFDNWVTCLAFSPDGKTLAVGAWHRILLWEATTGRDRLPLGGHANQVNRVRFSPDGKAIATWSEEALILWDSLTGRERQRWTDRGWLLDFTPAGALLTGHQGAIVEWDIASGKTLHTFQVFEHDHPDDVTGFEVNFAPDGKAMVSGANDRTIRLWSMDTGKELWRAKRTSKGVRFPADIGRHMPLGFTHDGKAVVTFADDCLARFWDAATGKELRWFPVESPHGRLSPDGRFLIAVGKEEVAPDGSSQGGRAAPPRLWDLTTGEKPRPIVLHPKPSFHVPVALSPDSSVVALEVGNEIVLIERASAKEIRRLSGHKDGILSLAFSPDARLLVSGSHDLTALVWDVTGLMRNRRFPELRLSPEELEAAWADLSDSDAAKAHRAIWKLVAAPRDAVPFLGSRLKPVTPADPDRVAKLIADLDSKTFAVREKAAKELEALAELAEPAVRNALAQRPSEEVRSRLNKLLERPAWPETDADRLRSLRSVSALGQIQTAEAQKVLDALAQGAPESRVTREASLARDRLAARTAKPR